MKQKSIKVKIIDANGCEITLSDFVIRRKPIDARLSTNMKVIVN
jgi:hypothetical protein